MKPHSRIIVHDSCHKVYFLKELLHAHVFYEIIVRMTIILNESSNAIDTLITNFLIEFKRDRLIRVE